MEKQVRAEIDTWKENLRNDIRQSLDKAIPIDSGQELELVQTRERHPRLHSSFVLFSILSIP